MIRDLHATRGTDADLERGLLGYLRLVYGDLQLDGIALRRTLDGRLTLAWPERTDRQGRRHALIRPIDDASRRAIEDAVLRELNRREREPDRATSRGERKP